MPQVKEEALQDLRSGEVRILIATGKRGGLQDVRLGEVRILIAKGRAGDPEPLEKKQEPEPLGKKNQETEPLEKLAGFSALLKIIFEILHSIS